MITELLERTHLVRTLRFELKATQDALHRMQPRPARIRLEDVMSEEEIGRHLGGTADSPVVKAILAKTSQSLVMAVDRASDEPSDAFTTEQRTHTAGGASALAQLLAELQELVVSKEKKEERKP